MGFEHARLIDFGRLQNLAEPVRGPFDSESDSVGQATDERGKLVHQLAMTSNNRSVWPEPEVRATAHLVSDRHREAVPPRPNPDAEVHDFPTQMDRDLNRLWDFWDAIPLVETGVWIVGALGAGLVAAALLARFAPLAMVALRTELGRRLGTALMATSAGIYFNQWFDAAWTASDDPRHRQQKIDEARNAFIQLGKLCGVPALREIFRQSVAVAKGTTIINPASQTSLSASQTSLTSPPTYVPTLQANAWVSQPLSAPQTGDSSLVSLASGISTLANNAVEELKRFYIQGNDGRWYPTPSGGAFEPNERALMLNRLDATPDLAPLNDPKYIRSIPFAKQGERAKQLVELLNRKFKPLGVVPLQVEVTDSIVESYIFSEQDWKLTLKTHVVMADFDPLNLSTTYGMMTTVFARVMQCWEVIRYIQRTPGLPAGQLMFPQHVLEKALQDNSPFFDEPRVKRLYQSMTSPEMGLALEEIERAKAVQKVATQKLKALEASQAPADMVERAFDEWQRSNWAVDKAQAKLEELPHMHAARKAGREAEQDYNRRTHAARAKQADANEFPAQFYETYYKDGDSFYNDSDTSYQGGDYAHSDNRRPKRTVTH